MQDTGLNILAVAIFTMTLSVLIGPFFDLSPIIPAGITFTLLSLITIDTLSWKNQGINLLLNFFASQEQKERIIYHEAGHFLVAYLYNIPISGYTLTPWEAIKNNNLGLGGVIFDTSFLQEKSQDLRELNLTIEKFGVALMAGVAGETFIYKNSQGGEEDYRKLREIYQPLKLNNDDFQFKKRLAILQAKTVIEVNKNAYLALVEAMKQRKSVLECQKIIQDLI